MVAAKEAFAEVDDDGDGSRGQWRQRRWWQRRTMMAAALQEENDDVGGQWWQRIRGVHNHK